MDGFWSRHRLTSATLLMAAFTLFLAVAIALDTGETREDRTAGGVVFGVCTAALLVGLWLIREGRSTLIAYPLIIIAAGFPGVGLFWMFLLPTALAFVIVYFGVVRGGLVRELRPSPAAPPRSS
ncbi:MAG: hypothetical protein GWN79_19350 [Actinobacteria bacterium]|nr:hypothetical protein [Actinomycetota bacterium]NIS34347.1 hypothetical protein [Actinomycetota bacterium]NIT97420.1 hypothetical protein [Actinomycetota bacterium]NIU21093.1 hypothetical protein [Actinomycetota bacterium]NIU69131.1 hypothetical protein [Actinomycetota bacterium]